MASIQLTGLWVHSVPDLADYVWFQVATAITMVPSKQGEVRELSGGRTAYRGRPTRRREYTVTVRTFSRANRDKLGEWAGKTLLFRDGVRYGVYGVYHEAPTTELKGIDGRDITLTVHSLSYDPSV